MHILYYSLYLEYHSEHGEKTNKHVRRKHKPLEFLIARSEGEGNTRDFKQKSKVDRTVWS